MTQVVDMDEKWLPLVAKVFGVACGVLLSLVLVAPESTRNALYRIFFGGLGGIIFMPVTQRLIPVFSGNETEIIIAASAATGFVCWFILELIARAMSSRVTLDRLLAELLRLRGINVPIDNKQSTSEKD
jgi:hypothetical protein